MLLLAVCKRVNNIFVNKLHLFVVNKQETHFILTSYLKSLKDPLVSRCGDVALSLNRLNSLKDPPSPDPLSPDTTLSGGL